MYENYYARGNRRRKRDTGVGVLVKLGIVFVIIAILFGMSYYEEKNYTVTVTEKGIKEPKFLVFTKTEDDEIRVFSIEDTLIKKGGMQLMTMQK